MDIVFLTYTHCIATQRDKWLFLFKGSRHLSSEFYKNIYENYWVGSVSETAVIFRVFFIISVPTAFLLVEHTNPFWW